jgi:outer membrane lipoprotein LolB
VSDGHEGGSGSLTWTQDGDHYDFVVRAPITGRSFRLRGGPDGAELDGLKGGPVHGRNAQRLLRRALGWQVPVEQLRAWVRGLRAPGSRAQLAFDREGLPSQIVQDGWTVRYPDWFAEQTPPMPRKVYAERKPYRVRVAIESWTLL